MVWITSEEDTGKEHREAGSLNQSNIHCTWY